MKMATGQSTHSDTSAACHEAYRSLVGELGEAPRILYLAWSVTYSGAEVLELLGDLAPDTRIHGTSSCLGAMTQQAFVSKDGRGIALLGIADEGGSYGVGGKEITGSPRDAATAALLLALKNSGREGEIPALVRLSAVPGAEEEIIGGIQDILGPNVPIVGGSAADNTVEGRWELAANQTLYQNAVVVSVLYPSVEMRFAFHSGYSPTEIHGIATRAEGRLLYEIDGQPAAEVYNRWTKGAVHDALPSGGNVLGATTLHPIGRVVGEVGGIPYYRLSHPDSVTVDGALTLFSDIEPGDELVLMHGSVDTLVTRARRVVHSAISDGSIKENTISGAMIVYCAGCMLTVQDQMEQVVDELNQELVGAPFLGTFTFGEQGCFVGGENHHGNLMISAVIFGS